MQEPAGGVGGVVEVDAGFKDGVVGEAEITAEGGHGFVVRMGVFLEWGGGRWMVGGRVRRVGKCKSGFRAAVFCFGSITDGSVPHS